MPKKKSKNSKPSKWASPKKIGDIFYIMGATKVKIIGMEDTIYPFCEVLEPSPYSQFEKGQKKRIYNRVLYPKREKGPNPKERLKR